LVVVVEHGRRQRSAALADLGGDFETLFLEVSLLDAVPEGSESGEGQDAHLDRCELLGVAAGALAAIVVITTRGG
jgi:hypothetical protein